MVRIKKRKLKPVGEKKWYMLEPSQVIHELASSAQGLTNIEAQKRLEQYGPNLLSPKRQSWLRRAIEPFLTLFMAVLFIAIIISLITGKRFDAAVISFVIVLNAIIYYFQQYSVNKVLKSLRAHEDGSVSVLRDGKTVELAGHELVPGDIVYLFEGMKVPADGRLIESTNLTVDESILTGESLPHSKNIEATNNPKEIFDQDNMLFKGTLVHAGSGMFIVCETGNQTQLGTISELASSSDIGRTPIEKKIDDITRKIIVGIAIIGCGVFGLAILRGISYSEALRFTLSLVVSVVPEGLPITLTVVLLLSAKKMATHKALVKKLSSIETMGAVTLIATDKTGTLTENKLAVADTLDSSGGLHEAASLSINKQNGMIFDPLDTLISKAFKSKRGGIARKKDFTFSQKLRMSGVLYQTKPKKYLLYVKGAPEALIKNLTGKKAKNVRDMLDAYTKKGYRVVAFGHIDLSSPIQTLEDVGFKRLIFDGLVALADPMRKNVPRAINEARTAGINVVMLTGDHKNTAEEIARQAGLIASGNEVADSALLESTRTPKIMHTLLQHVHVFGRVLPKHKFNFLKSIKNSEVTAMTGDGVNDIPALVEADAGLAMGSGTDAAKDASDIVLLDDNFSTIVDAVRLGRAVVANIRKMIFYMISTSLGEAATMIGALLIGLPLPVTAVQILWINLVTDSFTVLPIGLGKGEKHQMHQPPRDPKTPLLSGVLMHRTIFVGIVMAAVTLSLFYVLLPKGYAYAQSIAFMALVVAQWANALNANYERHSWVRNFIQPNFKLFLGLTVSIIFQVVAMYGPLQEPLGVVPLEANDLLLVCLLPTIAVLLAADMHKLLFRDEVKLLTRRLLPKSKQ